ncbi:hypothetical protein [Thiosocius teredinicola]|uniref:hypothetical protein n=1 Tax=Thiosocius teredinicola TaxID=1973002 RepID=UPI0009911B7E
MHKLGVYALIIGAILTVVGLVVGFSYMFAGNDQMTKIFLAAVPLGFVIGFAGVVMTLFSDPESSDSP